MDISFAVSCLARYSACPTRRHWGGIKHILRYLRVTEDNGLFYRKDAQNARLHGYADAGYLSDPHNAKSQSGYVFMQQGAAISWRSVKQSLTATSTTHADIIALYDASKECVWLRSIDAHIRRSTGLPSADEPTTLHEDNKACLDMIHEGYIKGDKTKHISPK